MEKKKSLVLETARADCSPKKLHAHLKGLKIEPIFSKFSYSLLQMSSLLWSFSSQILEQLLFAAA